MPGPVPQPALEPVEAPFHHHGDTGDQSNHPIPGRRECVWVGPRWIGTAGLSAVEGLCSTTLTPMYLGLRLKLLKAAESGGTNSIRHPLVAGGLSAHFLEEFPHRVELRAETFPVSGLQPLDCPVVAIERLLRTTCHGPTCAGCFLCHA